MYTVYSFFVAMCSQQPGSPYVLERRYPQILQDALILAEHCGSLGFLTEVLKSQASSDLRSKVNGWSCAVHGIYHLVLSGSTCAAWLLKVAVGVVVSTK